MNYSVKNELTFSIDTLTKSYDKKIKAHEDLFDQYMQIYNRPEQERIKLYKVIQEHYSNLGSYFEFKSKLSKEENIEILIKTLKEDQLYSQNIQDFKRRYCSDLYPPLANFKSGEIPGKFDSSKELWVRLVVISANDSLDFYYNNVFLEDCKGSLERLNINNGYDLKLFLDQHSFSDNDIFQKSLSISNQKIINSKILRINELSEKIIGGDKQSQISIRFFLILITIMFPIRYLIFTIKWSIQIIRQKE